jgi:hypothetical protein
MGVRHDHLKRPEPEKPRYDLQIYSSHYESTCKGMAAATPSASLLVSSRALGGQSRHPRSDSPDRPEGTTGIASRLGRTKEGEVRNPLSRRSMAAREKISSTSERNGTRPPPSVLRGDVDRRAVNLWPRTGQTGSGRPQFRAQLSGLEIKYDPHNLGRQSTNSRRESSAWVVSVTCKKKVAHYRNREYYDQP